jgi:hypothetical protein
VSLFPEDDDDAESKYAAVFPHSFQRVGGYVGNAFQERERERERERDPSRAAASLSSVSSMQGLYVL